MRPFIFLTLVSEKALNSFIDTFVGLNQVYKLIWNVVKRIPKVAHRFHFTVVQMKSLGVSSLPLVITTSCFTGGVAASQAAYQFANLVPLTYLGMAVCKAVLIELGPVLTALVMCGRIGAGIAAELGTMKTNEQIDAMECLALDPLYYLIAPRVIAGIIMFVVLTTIANFVAIIGAWFVSVIFLHVPSALFLNGLKLFFSPMDVFAGLIKAGVFGAIITFMGCYYGLNAEGGAEGVGKATMKAVVASCVLVLIFDFIVAALLF
jgi:phospholipid/cholesterol/gamma-HCH transport system permease protein